MRQLLAFVLVTLILTSGCISNGGNGTSTSPQNSSSETPTPPMTGNDVLDPTQTEEAMDVVGASNLFGIELYRELSRENGNLLISPFSVFTAMAMAYEGARGETAEEMAKVLHLPGNETMRREAFRTLLLSAWKPPGLDLRIANALWVQGDYPVREEYLDTIRQYYLGEVRELDFKGNPKGAERTINEWVEKKTNGRIKNLVSGLTPDTRLVITNAIYFKANWTLRFSPIETHNGTFTLPSGERVTVPMMNRVGKFNYAETDELQVIEMPYEGSRFSNFSMVIILPKKTNGLGKIEEKLSPQFLQGLLSSLKQEPVDVTLPKFRFEASYSLKRPLIEMGMEKAFSNGADFSGMSEGPLAISDVVHKTFISVAENGTEAAAATAVTITLTAPAEEPEYKIFRADRPFLFLIVNRNNGLVLFLGRLMDPRG